MGSTRWCSREARPDCSMKGSFHRREHVEASVYLEEHFHQTIIILCIICFFSSELQAARQSRSCLQLLAQLISSHHNQLMFIYCPLMHVSFHHLDFCKGRAHGLPYMVISCCFLFSCTNQITPLIDYKTLILHIMFRFCSQYDSLRCSQILSNFKII